MGICVFISFVSFYIVIITVRIYNEATNSFFIRIFVKVISSKLFFMFQICVEFEKSIVIMYLFY